ncbi:MAG: PRD domain-containing protein [Bacillota bacterium]|nr:PRD domain-containing protein [Bacillota bacterium]
MKIQRVLNNNAVVSKNEKGEEVILLGSGIAFKKKVGEEISSQVIEKIFTLSKKEERNYFSELVSQVPFKVVQVAESIIEYAQETLGKKLNDSIYLLLTDHIHYAIQRDRKGQSVGNKLIWEIEHFYPVEYKIGIKSVEMINEALGSNLLTTEAGFIAMHVVNATGTGIENEFDQEVSDIKAILKIVSFHFNTVIDESTMHYARFITHLRFFLQRMYSKTSLKKIDENDELFTIVCKKYFNSYLCVEKIDKYFLKERSEQISDEEKMYLVLHIERVISKEH